MKDGLMENLNKLALFFVVYTLFFIIFFGTLSYTLPFVLAFLFAYLLQNPTAYLVKKFKLKNTSASLITTIIFFLIFIVIMTIGIAALSSEVVQLTKNIQSYITLHTTDLNSLIDNLKVYYRNLDISIINAIEKNYISFISKAGNTTVALSGKIISSVLGFLASIPTVIMVIFFTLLATYFFTKDLTSAKQKFIDIMPSQSSDRIFYIFREARKMLGNYLKSYSMIICLTFIETLVGFLIFRINYAVLLSILAGFFDILPILGIGTIYIPLAIIYFLSKSYITAICIIVLYLIVSIIRQIVEPKVMSASLGIHPVAALAALFIGLKANGLIGIIFCMFLVVFYNILKKVKVL